MNKRLMSAAALFFFLSSANAQLKGAGSSFAATLYDSWGQTMTKSTSLKLDYDSTGSSAGVKAAQDGIVDFGASDRPLSRVALDQAGLLQFPTAIGGVVVVVNIPGIPSDKIRLDGTTLADVYLGRIKAWNDNAIKTLNPDLNLPAAAITPLFRSEGSGTSFVFTSYLSKVSPAFKSAYGATSNLTVQGGKGAKTSAELSKLVRETAGAIAHLDYAYASDLQLPMVQLKNQWGTLVKASPDSLQLAMRAMDWEKLQIDQDPSFEMDLTDAGCPGCWPIASATYVLVPLKGRNGNSARVLEFFAQAIQQGDEIAAKEGYVPLPTRAKNIVNLSIRRWNVMLEKSGTGKPIRRSHIDQPNLVALM